MRIRVNPAAIAAMSDVDRARTLALLEEYRRRAEWNPLETYSPHAKQHEVHSSMAKLRALFGGNRAGKTTSGVVDSLIQATPDELLPSHLKAYKRYSCPFYCRVISPSNDLIRQVIVPKFREWTPRALCKGESFDKAYRKFDKQITLECGCRFDLMSHEQELDKFGGSALHRILYDEEPPEDIRDESWARLLDYGGDEFFAMTPLKGLTWMFEAVLEAAEDPVNAQRIKVVIASMLENPYLPANVRDEVMAMWGHDSEVAQARIFGNFIHFGGMVLPSWRNALRSTVPGNFHRKKQMYVGIDPGVRNTGLVWMPYEQETDIFTIIRAFKLQDMDVAQISARIKEINAELGLEPTEIIYVIDPSARNRTLTHATSVEAEFNNYGIYPRHGQHEVEAGVFQMRRRINHGKLRVDEGLMEWRNEARQYRIQERTDGRFAVVKDNDHLMDPTRYVCMERPYLPKIWTPPPKAPNDMEVCVPPKSVAARNREPSGHRFA